MAFVTFRAEGRTSYGITRHDGVFDLGRRLGAVLPDLKSFLVAQDLDILGAVPESAVTDYVTGQFTYLPVIPNPAKVLCVGVNYDEHRRETGRSVTEYPTIFTRFADTLVGHGGPILFPPNSSALDYEGELAVIIGRPTFRVDEYEAMRYVAGYSVFNDATLRDWQRHTSQFTSGKNFPDTGALGPTLIIPQEAGSLANKKIETRLNGAIMQSAHLGDMIFSIPRIIAYISGFTRLAPGDIIATGTPGGVGAKREPPLFMKPGDRVDVTIEGIGTLTNSIEQETDSSSPY